jgi:hypothetical protein
MLKRVLIFGAILAIIAAALIIILAILDVVTIRDVKETLGKTLSIVGVSVLAIVLIIAMARLAGKG